MLLVNQKAWKSGRLQLLAPNENKDSDKLSVAFLDNNIEDKIGNPTNNYLDTFINTTSSYKFKRPFLINFKK